MRTHMKCGVTVYCLQVEKVNRSVVLDADRYIFPSAFTLSPVTRKQAKLGFFAHWMNYGNGLRGQVHDGNGDECAEVG